MEDRKLVLPYDIELHNSINAIEFWELGDIFSFHSKI